MIITAETFELGRSANGSWSIRQLKALGLGSEWFREDNSLKSGWRQYLLGLDVPKENVKMFIALKNSHLNPEKCPKLLEQHNLWRSKVVEMMDNDNLAHLHSITGRHSVIL